MEGQGEGRSWEGKVGGELGWREVEQGAELCMVEVSRCLGQEE